MKDTRNNFMDLNRETAMRLWNKKFGKATKAVDFAGREIMKGAYNQRGSEFGWNVDHILPQSRGGVTADHNLEVCHILTNDEKADKFPCFNANKQKFEIVKVENHYEIHLITNDTSKKASAEAEPGVNFMDSASGIKFFKKLKGIQNQSRFVGTVLIRLKNVSNNAVIDFVERFFDQENITFEKKNNYGYAWTSNEEIRILVRDYNMPEKTDTSALLDKCIMLNTYFQDYFKPLEYVEAFEIIYRLDCYKEKDSMYEESLKVNFNNINDEPENNLFINNTVIINTEANEKLKEEPYNRYSKYDYVFTNLSKNLNKEVSGK